MPECQSILQADTSRHRLHNEIDTIEPDHLLVLGATSKTVTGESRAGHRIRTPIDRAVAKGSIAAVLQHHRVIPPLRIFKQQGSSDDKKLVSVPHDHLRAKQVMAREANQEAPKCSTLRGPYSDLLSNGQHPKRHAAYFFQEKVAPSSKGWRTREEKQSCSAGHSRMYHQRQQRQCCVSACIKGRHSHSI